METSLSNGLTIYNKTKNAKTALLLGFRGVSSYAVKKDNKTLLEVYKILKLEYEQNMHDMSLLALIMICEYCLSYQFELSINVEKIINAKSYFKENSSYILALSNAFIITNNDKNISEKIIKKHYENIEILYNEQKCPYICFILAYLNFFLLNNKEIGLRYYKLLESDTKSLSQFIAYLTYHKNIDVCMDKSIAKNALLFAEKNNLPFNDLLYTNGLDEGLKDDIYTQIELRRLHHFTGYYKFLDGIVNQIITNKQVSMDNYDYLCLAKKWQINHISLDSTILKNAYSLNIKNIPLSTVEKYLQKKYTEPDVLAFLYAIIAGNEEDFYKYVLNENRQSIIDFAYKNIYSEKGENNPYYAEVFKYAYDETKDATFLPVVFPWIFKFHIKSTDDFYLFDSNKKYPLHVLSNEHYVIITGYYKTYTTDFLAEKNIDFEKVINNIDYEFVKTCYECNFYDENSLIYLSNYILDYAELANFHVEILLKVCFFENLSEDFIHKVFLRLGKHYSTLNNIENAFFYYNLVPENKLTKEDYDRVLKAYFSIKEYDKCFNLIVTKEKYLSLRTIFNVTLELSKLPEYKEKLCPYMYKLILKNWFHKDFLNTILDHYETTRDNWILLRDVVYGFHIYNEFVDEKIIIESLEKNCFDFNFQVSFVNIYNKNKNNKVLQESLYPLCYHILFENVFIEDFTKEVLISLLSDKTEIFYKAAYAVIGETIDFNEFENKSILLPILVTKFPNWDFGIQNYPVLCHGKVGESHYITFKIDDSKDETCEMSYFGYGIYCYPIKAFFGDTITYTVKSDDNSIVQETSHVKSNANTLKNTTLYDFINNAKYYESQNNYKEVELIIKKKIEKDRSKSLLALTNLL